MAPAVVPRSRRGRRSIAVAVLVIAFAAGCGSSGDGAATPTSAATETTSPSAGRSAPGDPTPLPLAWTDCDDGLQCATLTVPVDYANPSGGTVELAVVKRPATDADGRIGPLVVNPGGPGGSGVDLVRSGWGQDSGLGRFDVVSWDPRGVGDSTRLDCGEGAPDFLALERDDTSADARARLDDAARAVADDCGAHAGPLLENLDTTTTVRDVDQLRQALGADQLSFAGYSYGTAIGLAYLERYPDRLRALVLDGVVQPEWDLEAWLGAQTNSFDQSLDATFADCDADAACPVDHASTTYDRVAERLAAEPLMVDGDEFNRTDLAVAAISSAYDPGSAQDFLQGLADADRGDAHRLQELVDGYAGLVSSYPSYAGVECTDLPHPVGADAYAAFVARLAERSPRFGAAIGNELLPCAFWPVPTAASPHPAPTNATGPSVLVVGTTGDPATPYASAQAVTRQLGNVVLLTDTGRGHTSGGRSSCVTATVRRYLVDLALPPANALCAEGS